MPAENRNGNGGEENQRSGKSSLSGVWPSNPVAIVVGDLHLRHDAPVSRAEKKEAWYEVMKQYLFHLRSLADKWNVPILCTGDYFHKWNSPSELVNFALEHLPHTYGIPGNHDLPHHRLEDVEKSSYWTLVKAGMVTDLKAGVETSINPHLHVTGFPWGVPLKNAEGQKSGVRVAIAHKYVWWGNHKYPDAPPEAHIGRLVETLSGYHLAAFGDNHKGFLCPLVDRQHRINGIFNNGGFYRSKSDEIEYQPRIGVVYKNGYTKEHRLDDSLDQWVDNLEETKALESDDQGAAAFVLELARLGDAAENFVETVQRLVSTMSLNEQVRELVNEALEKGNANAR